MAKFPRVHDDSVRSIKFPRVVGDFMSLSTEYELVNGIATKVIKPVLDVPKDRNKGLSFNDFRLSNLIAVGAVDKLAECTPLSPSSMKFSDSVPEPSKSEEKS